MSSGPKIRRGMVLPHCPVKDCPSCAALRVEREALAAERLAAKDDAQRVWS